MNEPMSDQEIREIEALAEGATPGEWHAHEGPDYSEVWDTKSETALALVGIDPANANFIAASRTAVPRMAGEIRRLREALKLAQTQTGDLERIGKQGAWCFDCGEKYGTFPDYVLPNADWAKIAPHADGNGILCPTCISKRLNALGLWRENERAENARLARENTDLRAALDLERKGDPLSAEVERLREALKGAMVVAEAAKGLNAENARLREELEAAERFMREMADDPNWCRECEKCPCCKNESEFTGCSGFIWRGVCPANCGEQGAPFDEPMQGANP